MGVPKVMTKQRVDKIANMGKVELSSKPSENVSKLYININKGKDDEI